MYYFVNTSINPKKSGIEHAEMKRLALFNQHHVPAKMVTRFFSLSLHQTLTAAGIAAENQINLFDFIQHSSERPTVLAPKVPAAHPLAAVAPRAMAPVVANEDNNRCLIFI